MTRGAALLAGALVTTSAAAQDKITPQEFLDRANGNTLTFFHQRSGSVAGVEQFLSPKQSVWAQSDGRCSYGDISIKGELMCFLYEDFPNPDNCWMPFDMDGQLMVMSTQSFQVQTITDISQDPVICEGAPLS
ncbi:hypothetical protein [uncultured Litoreibacter sp.]|uniref:hypothetical protein n=1 Tax=uncultured Litoreibacter sp. TaxID=1392394 RepID=UPI00262116A4|nr:hypothetical protein [uncultured Litoreibacter sp.]